MMFSSVDLPQPDAPTMQAKCAVRDLEGHVVERVHVAVAGRRTPSRRCGRAIELIGSTRSA